MTSLDHRPWLAEIGRGGRFAAVGLTGLAVDTAVFALFHHLGAGRALARAGSLALATCVTWAINRRITFRPTGRRRTRELVRYAFVAAVAQGFNYGLFLTLGVLFPAVEPVLLIPVCAVAAGGFSYAGQRLFTFSAVAKHLHREPS